MAKNRYIGEYPVIGIRPTIDGRRGPLKVRESLEDQTMAMAQAAKKLFEDTMEIRRKIDVQNWKIIKERAWYKNAVIAVIKALSPKGVRPRLIKELDETCRRFEGPEMTQYVGCVCAAHNGLKEILQKEWFAEYIKVPFEEYTFQIPAHYHEILSGFYNGDYMQLPPPEKRKSHHVYDAEWKDEEQ